MPSAGQWRSNLTGGHIWPLVRNLFGVSDAGRVEGERTSRVDSDSSLHRMRIFMVYGAGHPMIGTVLMLFCGLPSITRSL
jgi:hypothetical protein